MWCQDTSGASLGSAGADVHLRRAASITPLSVVILHKPTIDGSTSCSRCGAVAVEGRVSIALPALDTHA